MTTSYEFNYFMSVVKYSLFYYLFMGVFPLLFEKMDMNSVKRKRNLLFRNSDMMEDHLCRSMLNADKRKSDKYI